MTESSDPISGASQPHFFSVQSRETNRQLFGLWQDRLRSLKAIRRPTLDLLASEWPRPRWPFGGAFPERLLQATEAAKEKPRRSGATHQEKHAQFLLY